MITAAVLSLKGGVGKTTTVLGLASAASTRGSLRTLVVDLDPQCNASEALGVSYPVDYPTSAELLNGTATVHNAVGPSSWDRVSVIAGDLDLADFDTVGAIGVEQRLRAALSDPLIADRFDLVLIDCPPSLGKLVSNALVAADAALVATEPSFMASRGVAKVLTAVEAIRRYYNPGLVVAGVLLGRVPARGREASHRASEIREALGDLVLPLTVPLRAVIAEAAGDGRPIHQARPPVPEATAAFDAALDQIMLGDNVNG